MKNQILLTALSRVETQSVYAPSGEEMLVISRRDYERLINILEGVEFLIKDEHIAC
ncbi:hypothetical protein [Maritalea porphyrae]|jgi:hypothetical protein|uniref:hypothetical protein n=1 Tax=Maritalea porphyrae TaxID=880732 RepID=UPI0022AFE252|nr:hypothetical protein [Maritalea porphyrae]MCZ4273537.1 hypothetical protein [Maritalea porphyrae]